MALAHSMNLPTVRLGLSLGPAAVLKTMREAGYAGDAKALPSIFLGAVDASPLQMAEMYGTPASGGFHAEDGTSTRLNSSHSCASRMPSSACQKKQRAYACSLRDSYQADASY